MSSQPRLVVEIADADEHARTSAEHLAEALGDALAERQRVTLALSGGSTMPPVLAHLLHTDLPWSRVTILQVDERIAPEGHPDRNLTALAAHRDGSPAAAATLHPMPVTDVAAGGTEPAAAADAYSALLRDVAGPDVVIDVVQLGLGDDGHTASLVPGDDVLEVTGRPVAVTDVYQGRRRMTLTYEVLDAARHRCWVVAGADKHDALTRLIAGDRSIPAGRVARDAVIVADRPSTVGPGREHQADSSTHSA